MQKSKKFRTSVEANLNRTSECVYFQSSNQINWIKLKHDRYSTISMKYRVILEESCFENFVPECARNFIFLKFYSNTNKTQNQTYLLANLKRILFEFSIIFNKFKLNDKVAN